MARDLSGEPQFPTHEIQGDILAGLAKKHQHLLFFQIVDTKKFRAFIRSLHLTSMQECLDQRATIAANKRNGVHRMVPAPGLNVAFTFSGLQALGVPDFPALPALEAFRKGMHARQSLLGDPPASKWKVLRPSDDLHGVFIVTGASHSEAVDVMSLRLAPADENGWKLRHEEAGQVRPDPVSGHEHFGYADGVSQPGVRGRLPGGEPLTPQAPGAEDTQGQKGQDVLWPGEFVFGYVGQDPNADSFDKPGPLKEPPVAFMRNGSFLVFRRLAQKVPEFNRSVKAAASEITGTENPVNPDLLGAQMVGRWKSGAALINAPTQDDFSIADGTENVNAFEFGDDRMGLKCPWAAHIRKAYPRDDLRHSTQPADDEVKKAEAFTQTHRMLRRGIAFGPEVTESEALSQRSAGGDKTRGLLFMCYVTSIENQFEFVQQQWCDAADFSQPGSGIDPIIGQSAQPLRPWLGAAPVSQNAADKPALQLRSFVQMEGGGYFFAPSIAELAKL